MIGAADQRHLALSGGDARLRHAHGIDAGGLLAHEGARGTDNAVDERNIAGEQIGELRQKQGRPQVAHQALVEKGAWLVDLAHTGHDRGIDRDVALAASGGNDHVGMIEQVGIAGEPGIGQRQAGGINADPLPGFHLPLVAFLRDLLVETHRRKLMHDVGREALVVVGRRIAALETAPSRIQPLAQTGEKTDAGDPHLAAFGHFTNSLAGKLIRSAHSHSPARSSGVG